VIVDYYRNHCIDVNAVQADGRWNAEVRTLRLFSQDNRRRNRHVPQAGVRSRRTRRGAVGEALARFAFERRADPARQ
jgi:hypothetical protein